MYIKPKGMEVEVVTFFLVRKIPLGRNTGLSLRLKIKAESTTLHVHVPLISKKGLKGTMTTRPLTHNFESRSPLFV